MGRWKSKGGQNVQGIFGRFLHLLNICGATKINHNAKP
jgi:hypothetical protein